MLSKEEDNPHTVNDIGEAMEFEGYDQEGEHQGTEKPEGNSTG